MAKNRLVDTRFWSDSYIERLDPIERLTFLYFLTNNHTDICGIYEVPLKLAAVEIGIDRDVLSTILSRFVRDEKMYYDNGWVALKNFIRYQTRSPKIVRGIEIGLSKAPPHLVEWVKTEISPNPAIKRVRLSSAKRRTIKERDKFKCVNCGKGEPLEVDHIVAVENGGSNEPENLRTLCQSCHRVRHSCDMVSHTNTNTNTNTNLNSNLNLNPKNVVAATPATFSLKDEIAKMEDNPKRHIQVLGLYFKQKRPDIRSKAQLNEAIKRHVRSAAVLSKFDDDQIVKAFRKASDMIEGWTIETAVKIVTK